MKIKQRFSEAFKILFKGISTSHELSEYLLAGGGRMSKAGINISPETAMRVSAVYACVRVLAENVAQLPLIVYERAKDGRGKDRLPGHALSKLLRRPNFWQTPFEFWETMLGHVVLRGNAYAIKNIVRGQTKELIPIHPGRVEVFQDHELKLTYKVTDAAGKVIEFPRERIFHLKGLSANSVTGVSPITLAREAIGLALATEQHGSALFKNGATPGSVLTHPGKLSVEAAENLKESWEKRFTGDNAFGTAVLEEGMEWKQVGMSMEDSQFIETRKFQMVDIARWFRVPPHKIGILDRATFSNIEQQSIDFVIDSLMPWLVRTEQAVMRDLILPGQRDEVFVEFLIEGLLRGDSKTRSEFYKKAILCGWMSRNEVREKENLNPIEGLDEILVPLNMVSNDEAKDDGDENPDDDSKQDAPQLVFGDEQGGNGNGRGIHF